MGNSLYELNAMYENLLDRLYDEDLPEDAIIDTLECIQDAIEDKAEGYSRILRQLATDIDRIKDEEVRLAKRRRALERSENVLKNNLFTAMKTVGLGKIKTSLFTVSIQKNGGKRPVIITATNTSELPTEFVIAKVEPNKEYIREYLEAGNELPFAYIGEQGESLRIR